VLAKQDVGAVHDAGIVGRELHDVMTDMVNMTLLCEKVVIAEKARRQARKHKGNLTEHMVADSGG
jgi:hypothetical protein